MNARSIWGASNDYLARPDVWGKKNAAIRVRPASQTELYAVLAFQIPAGYPSVPPELELELNNSKGLSHADAATLRAQLVAHEPLVLRRLLAHEVQVVVDEQDRVARRNPGERDQSHQGGDRHRLAAERDVSRTLAEEQP